MLGCYIHVNVFSIWTNIREDTLRSGCRVLYYAYHQNILYMWWNMSYVLHVNTRKWENHYRLLYKKPYSYNIKTRDIYWKIADLF